MAGFTLDPGEAAVSTNQTKISAFFNNQRWGQIGSRIYVGPNNTLEKTHVLTEKYIIAENLLGNSAGTEQCKTLK